MAVRSTHNVARTDPWGRDFADVLKRSKAYYKDGTFFLWQYKEIWQSGRPSIAFKDPDGSIYFTKQGRHWVRQ